MICVTRLSKICLEKFFVKIYGVWSRSPNKMFSWIRDKKFYISRKIRTNAEEDLLRKSYIFLPKIFLTNFFAEKVWLLRRKMRERMQKRWTIHRDHFLSRKILLKAFFRQWIKVVRCNCGLIEILVKFFGPRKMWDLIVTHLRKRKNYDLTL